MKFLALYFSLAPDDGEEHLARRIGDGEVRPSLRHLEDEHDGERRAEAEHGEADEIDRRQRAGSDAAAEALEEAAGGEHLRDEAQHADRQIDAGEDARLRRRAVHLGGDDVRLREVEHRRPEREQAHPSARCRAGRASARLR